MSAITKANVMAATVVFGIARGVVDDIRPCSGEESDATDGTVFKETMAALEKKGGNNGESSQV